MYADQIFNLKNVDFCYQRSEELNFPKDGMRGAVHTFSLNSVILKLEGGVGVTVTVIDIQAVES